MIHIQGNIISVHILKHVHSDFQVNLLISILNFILFSSFCRSAGSLSVLDLRDLCKFTFYCYLWFTSKVHLWSHIVHNCSHFTCLMYDFDKISLSSEIQWFNIIFLI